MLYVRYVGGVLLLLVIGLALAVYPVFVVIFSGNPAQTGYGSPLLLVAAAYFFCAALTGLATRSWTSAFWLTPPAIVVLIRYSTKEISNMLFHLAVAVALILGTALGATVGVYLRGPRRQRV